MVQCICVKIGITYKSKVFTHKISFILNLFKSHIIDLDFNNKTSYINHEYEIDSYVFLNVILHY